MRLSGLICDLSRRHEFGDCSFDPPGEDQCVERKVCERCGRSEEHLVDHLWTPLEFDASRCRSHRHCLNCKKEEETFHQYGPWHRVTLCEEKRICSLCKAWEIRDSHHWRDVLWGSCLWVEECSLCAKQRKGEYKHHFLTKGKILDDLGNVLSYIQECQYCDAERHSKDGDDTVREWNA
jgi:hypothetical protein